MSTNVALLGAGYIAEWHARALRAVPGVRVSAVCDVSTARAAALAGKFGITQTYSSLAELLANGKPDAVHVLLPAERHREAIETLLAAGVPTFAEKPLCPSAADCRAVADLARSRGVALGVSHNFLFDEAYERLRADVRAGKLGRLDQVTITWNRALPQLRSGPFGSWLLRGPGHVMLEIGPHSVAHLLDLVGVPDSVTTEADRPVELPTGIVVPRRWLVRARCGSTVVNLAWSFEPGHGEHRIDVRGAAGAACCDLERGTYVLRRGGASGQDDLERYRQTVAEGKALRRAGRRVFGRYVAEKLKLSRRGSLFANSIAGAHAAFYAGLGGTPDERLTADYAARVMEVCEGIAAARGPHPPSPPLRSGEGGEGVLPLSASERGPGGEVFSARGTVLVLGGTGFIGQVLVRQLVDAGRPVRLLTRDPGNLPAALRGLPIEIVRGDLGNAADVDRACAGVDAVVHLARGDGKTWEHYVRADLEPTRLVAAACLKHRVRRLVYTGTIDSLYTAKTGAVITDDTPVDPKIHRRNLYALAKATGERELADLRVREKLPVVIARPGVVVGVGGPPFHWGSGHWPAPYVCRFWGRGDTPLPLVLVDDVATALAAMVDAPGIEGETFNLVAETDITAREYADAVARTAGAWVDGQPKSAWRSYVEDMAKYVVKVLVRHPGRRLPSLRDWDTRSHRARFDCSKAKRLLGWQPVTDRDTLLRRGVEEPTRAWLA